MKETPVKNPCHDHDEYFLVSNTEISMCALQHRAIICRKRTAQYSDQAMGWTLQESWFHSRQGQEFLYSQSVQTGSGDHPTSFSMSTCIPSTGSRVAAVLTSTLCQGYLNQSRYTSTLSHTLSLHAQRNLTSQFIINSIQIFNLPATECTLLLQ